MVFPVVGGTQDTSYEIENSLRTGGGDNHHLSMVYSSAASDANRRKFTFSGWIKLGQAAHYSTTYANDRYLLASTDAAVSTTSIGYGYTAGDFHMQDGRSGTYIYTTTKFRDPSAWYHLVVKYDSTQGTASDRIFIYVNGESQPLAYSNSGDPEVDLNTAVDFFSAGDNIDATSADSGNFVHNVNSYYNSGFGAAAGGFDGYFADWYLLDGQASAPTEFAETNDNGVWVPKKYTGTFNSHSFHLEFKQTGSSANSSGIGADTSGQDNHFKVGVNSTLAAVDVTTDTPTNNFATLNPLSAGSDMRANGSFKEGNCELVNGGTGGEANGQKCSGTIGFANGKWYWEVKLISNTMTAGIVDSSISTTSDINLGSKNAVTYDSETGIIANIDGNVQGETVSSQYDDNDIIGVAVDADNGAVYFSKNGTYQNSGNPASGASKTGGASFTLGNQMLPLAADNSSASAGNHQYNFGNAPFSISSGNTDANGYGNFEYSVPSGYYALCTKNLAEYG